MNIHRLTATKVARKIAAKKLGRFCDGGGLYLQVTERSCSWVFRYRPRASEANQRWMGLGPTATVDLGEARERARQCRLALLGRLDPAHDLSSRRGKVLDLPALPTRGLN